jgi:hypothetical protein
MFDSGRPGSVFAAVSPPADVAASPAEPARVPLERVEAQMIGCTAALSWMTHGDGGAVLALGRRRRRPSAAIRRAARERDGCRCRFPGCESRRVDLHHIRHWINGGRTDLANLISLCPWHHKLAHHRGYLIAAPPAANGTFAFSCPDGTPLPSCPPLPEPDGPIGQAHDADITPDTIIPPRYGERLDLNHAIWTCFANARTNEEKLADGDQDGDPADRGRVTIYEPEDWPERIRRYEDEYPAGPRRPLVVPIPLLGCAHA